MALGLTFEFFLCCSGSNSYTIYLEFYCHKAITYIKESFRFFYKSRIGPAMLRHRNTAVDSDFGKTAFQSEKESAILFIYALIYIMTLLIDPLYSDE